MLTRRDFLGSSALLAADLVLPRARVRAAAARPAMVGIQVGAVSFVDEGTDQVRTRSCTARPPSRPRRRPTIPATTCLATSSRRRTPGE